MTQASDATPDTLVVRVLRTAPDARSEFTVRRFSPMTVLDALLAIQREHDDSIGFRFSCRVAMCGTCTVRVNGRSALACQRLIEHHEERIDVTPAAGMPVVRDLVVDTSPFWEQWRRVVPYVSPEDGQLDEPAQIPPDSAEREAIDPALDCIQCGACYSSCGIAGDDGQFIGPAALNRAYVLINDSRDAAGEERLNLLHDIDGVDRCRFMYGCTGTCPKGLDPAKAIRAVRTGRVKNR